MLPRGSGRQEEHWTQESAGPGSGSSPTLPHSGLSLYRVWASVSFSVKRLIRRTS